MRSSAAAASMQKTYDECYLICSTAVYYEKQNNEEEALKSWRNALDQIYYHNAYRVPVNYKVKSETEKALQDSLHDMEMQCKERVDLLGALRSSRLDASQMQENGGGSPRLPARRSASPAVSSSKASANGMIGDGTVPAINYPDLARPQFLSRPTVQRPLNAGRAYSSSVLSQQASPALTPQTTGSNSKGSSSVTLPVPPGQRESRTPSPEKKPGMLKTTLRPSTKETKSVSSKFSASGLRGRQKPAVAATAATLAWPSGQTVSADASSSAYSPSSQRSETVNSLNSLNNSGTSRHHFQPDSNTQKMPKSTSRSTTSAQTTPASYVQTFAQQLNSGRLSNVVTSNDPSLPQSSNPPISTLDSSSTGSHPSSASQLKRTVRPAPPPVPPHRKSDSSERVIPYHSSTPYQSEHGKDPWTRDIPKTPIASPEFKGVQRPGLASLPRAEFPSYRREYPKPEPMDARKADSIMASRNVPIETYRGSQSSSAAQTRTQQSKAKRQDSPTYKQGSPILRKAVGSTPPAMSAGLRSTSTIELSQSNKEPLLAELPADNIDSDEANAAAWDSRVKHLLQNLPRGVDEQAAKAIFNEIVIKGDEVHWEDVAGLDVAKTALKEAVVYPFLRPDLFMGLREPARGMLLFGPPGTGKTMLARAVATESRSTFFAISASSLTSKFLGESEKLVRALFALAKVLAPSIIFVDEIDSLLSSRSGSGEHEATRRIKTEFLIQWSDLQKAAAGRDTSGEKEGDASRVLVLAATNLPWAIDEAARRRFVRRQYIPLPEAHVRESQLRRLMSAQKHVLKTDEMTALVDLTDGFSGSDITALAKDAAMGPLRSLGEKLLSMSPEDIRPIGFIDFEASLITIRPSVSKQGLQEFEDWAREFGERGG